jgi:hypothetical protein
MNGTGMTRQSARPAAREESASDEGPDAGGLSFDDAGEAAQFLVRIFGEEARELAALRAQESSQNKEWRQVGDAVEEALRALPARKRVRRRFRPLK